MHHFPLLHEKVFHHFSVACRNVCHQRQAIALEKAGREMLEKTISQWEKGERSKERGIEHDKKQQKSKKDRKNEKQIDRCKFAVKKRKENALQAARSVEFECRKAEIPSKAAGAGGIEGIEGSLGVFVKTHPIAMVSSTHAQNWKGTNGTKNTWIHVLDKRPVK